ncbi:MAG: cobalt transporter [Oscillatoriales cyanobacterium]|nr:MAG: cobalt transporter [Oscillatoriales cyanobacterium]
MSKRYQTILKSILISGLLFSTPELVFAHVGHGDEFQATGGVNRVKVNPATDPVMGIEVTPIKPAAAGGAVMIPVTALVDADGKSLVFVQYKNFYEPVPITTGATKGEMVEVKTGLSAGEKLVTQGSLSLYAESRKTQSAEPESSTAAKAAPESKATDSASSPAGMTHAQADAQGVPHSHDASGNLAQANNAQAVANGSAEVPSAFPMGLIIAGGGGAVALLGLIAFLNRNSK